MKQKHPPHAWVILALSVGLIIFCIVLQIIGCAAHVPVSHDPEQYKYANPSARAACLKYDDGRECSQYMSHGP